MMGFIVKKKSSPRLLYVLLTVFFLSIPLQSTAQVIIREKLELSDTTKSSVRKVKAQIQNYRDAWYLQWGGSYSLTLEYLDWYDENDYQLYEEGLGLLTSNPDEGQTIQLGEFPQWHSFRFYLQHPETGNKVYIEPFENYGLRVDLWTPQKDSTLAKMPPQAALDYHGNPFEASGEVKVREDGFMRLDLRGGSIGKKDLYIDMPKDSLVKENIKEVYIEHVDVGTVREGEVYRFYIKSEFPIVADKKLYPEYHYWNNYDRIAELRFEDKTDLDFLDLTAFVEVVEHPKTPKYIRLRSNPSEVLPDYDEKTFFSFERINKDYSAENFPDDQTFDIKMDESKAQYATLHDPATNQKGTSLDNVTADFHMDIKSHEEIGDFTGGIEVEATTKVKDPVLEELVEISGDWDVEVVNKKMFLEFNPNPVAKGDTALVQRHLLYANGVEKQLPLDHEIPYASVHPNSRSFGTLRDISTGETGHYLYGVTEGLQFVARDDIAQDKVEAQMVASSYVNKEMPSPEPSALSSQLLSGSQSNFDDLSTEEKRLIDQRYWESVETGSVDTSGSDIPKLMESSDIGIMTHNSDQDYIYGSGSLIIGNELEPCKPYYPENQIFGQRVDNNQGCGSDDLGSTRVVPRSIKTNFGYCFSSIRNHWEGQLESFKQQVNYGICFRSVKDLNLIEINGAQDPNITEKSCCNLTKRLSKLLDSLEKDRRQYTGESINVWSPKAILEHEKVHVEQFKNEAYEKLILKEGGLVDKLKTIEYSLAKEQAANANEAKQKLSGKLDELKEVYLTELQAYINENRVRWQLEAEEPEEEVYAELIEAMQERAEHENWKPCNE